MLGKLFGEGAGDVIKAVADVADEYFETDEEKRQFQERVEQRIADTNKAQTDINKEDAKGNWFQAGWRPLVGYICAFAMALKFIILPFLVFFTGWAMPEIDWQEISVVLLGMLGLGGLRTYEKKKGLTK